MNHTISDKDLQKLARKRIFRGTIFIFLTSCLVYLLVCAYLHKQKVTEFDIAEKDAQERRYLWYNNWQNHELFKPASNYLQNLTSKVIPVSTDQTEKLEDTFKNDICPPVHGKLKQSWDKLPKNHQSTWILEENASRNVNYGVAVYLPTRDMLQIEKYSENKDIIINNHSRMAHAMSQVKKDFLNTLSQNKNTSKPVDYATYSDNLLKVLGMDSIKESILPELRVEWVYIASSNGAYQIYPANDENYKNKDGTLFNPVTRPWFKQANESNNDSGLSSAYIDFGERETKIVRTLWKKINVQNQNDKTEETTFVIGIDFKISKYTSISYPSFLENTCLPFFHFRNEFPTLAGLVSVIFTGLVCSIFFYLIFIFLSARYPQPIATAFVFGLVKPQSTDAHRQELRSGVALYFNNSGSPEIISERTTRDHSGFKSSSGGSAGSLNIPIVDEIISVLKKIGKWKEKEQIKGAEFTVGTSAKSKLSIDPKSNGIYGKDTWYISNKRNVEYPCPISGKPIEIVYSDENLNDVEVILSHGTRFNPDVRTADVRDDRILSDELKDLLIENIPKTTNLAPRILRSHLNSPAVEGVPEIVQNTQLYNKHEEEHKLLCSGKMRVDNIHRISVSLYEDSRINAICGVEYFKFLITKDDDFLITGSKVHRIVILKNEAEKNDFLEYCGSQKVKLDKLFSLNSNVKLELVLLSQIDNDDLKSLGFWDFAIVEGRESNALDGDFVLFLDQKRKISFDKGQIPGGITWRVSDVEMYRQVFLIIQNFTKKLDLEDLPARS